MRTKRILLIDDNEADIASIQNRLDQMRLSYNLQVTKSGREGLDCLMGSSYISKISFFKTRKLRPDIILINEKLPDTTGTELLEIIRKYHSLSPIKIFFLGDAKVDFLPAPEELAISGYLSRPFEADVNIKTFDLLKSELSTNHSYFMFLPLLKLKVKVSQSLSTCKSMVSQGKLIYLSSAQAVGAKVVIGTASGLVLSLAAISETRQTADRKKQVPETIIYSVEPLEQALKEQPVALTKTVHLSKAVKVKATTTFSPPTTLAKREEDVVPEVMDKMPAQEDKAEPRTIVIRAIEEADSSLQH